MAKQASRQVVLEIPLYNFHVGAFARCSYLLGQGLRVCVFRASTPNSVWFCSCSKPFKTRTLMAGHENKTIHPSYGPALLNLDCSPIRSLASDKNSCAFLEAMYASSVEPDSYKVHGRGPQQGRGPARKEASKGKAQWTLQNHRLFCCSSKRKPC